MASGKTTKQAPGNSDENLLSFFVPSQKSVVPQRTTLQVLQPSAVNKELGKASQGSRIVPKRKQWGPDNKGPKRVKVEVKATQTEDPGTPDDVSNEAYELMVKETAPSTYWREMAEERRKALYNVLQENERLQKEMETKNDQIVRLRGENEELQELAQHVQYMADMIERLTGKGPDNLEEIRDLALETEGEKAHDSTLELSDEDDSSKAVDEYGEEAEELLDAQSERGDANERQ